MCPELCVHDGVVTSYHVDSEHRTILIHTHRREANPPDQVAIEFSGVSAYHFEGDTLGTVLFDVTECTVEDIRDEYRELFVRLAPYGWPPVVAGQANRKAYLVSSSYGMHGFVFAESMRLVPTSLANSRKKRLTV